MGVFIIYGCVSESPEKFSNPKDNLRKTFSTLFFFPTRPFNDATDERETLELFQNNVLNIIHFRKH